MMLQVREKERERRFKRTHSDGVNGRSEQTRRYKALLEALRQDIWTCLASRDAGGQMVSAKDLIR